MSQVIASEKESVGIVKTNSFTIEQRLQISEEEVKALRHQLLSIKEICQKSQTEKKEYQDKWLLLEKQHRILLEESDRITLTCKEKDQLLQQKENAISELQKQLEVANRKSTAKTVIPKFESLSSLQMRESAQAIKEENELLSRSLIESQQHSKQLERVIQFLRERGEEAHLEAKQLREEFHGSREKMVQLQEQFKAFEHKEKELINRLQEIENLQNKLNERDQAIEQLQTAQENREQELKMAQQHLARKVKEMSVLSAKLEDQRTQILELQHHLTELQTKSATLQGNLDHLTRNEKQQQEQMVERLNSADNQIKRWEEKYFQLQEKLQEAENKHRFLKGLEDKHKQAYMMLMNLSILLEPAKIESDKQQIEPSSQSSTVQQIDPMQPLFERPVQYARHKTTLFE